MRAALARKKRQGLTYEELSRETGIPISTLAYWSRKLRTDEDEPVFDEVVIEDDDPPAGGLVVIGPLGHRVVVGQQFDPEHLRRVLESLPC
jgi:hypothetical protein